MDRSGIVPGDNTGRKDKIFRKIYRQKSKNRNGSVICGFPVTVAVEMPVAGKRLEGRFVSGGSLIKKVLFGVLGLGLAAAKGMVDKAPTTVAR